MTDNFPELIKDINSLIKKTQQIQIGKIKKKSTFGPSVVKGTNIWDQDL